MREVQREEAAIAGVRVIREMCKCGGVAKWVPSETKGEETCSNLRGCGREVTTNKIRRRENEHNDDSTDSTDRTLPRRS